MAKIYCVILEISPQSTLWAKTYYPQFLNPNLGAKKQESYLLSRALLLYTLQKYYDSAITALPDITYNEHLKPIFKDKNISFNLTHSSAFVALVITEGDHPVGVDIETIKPRKNFTGLFNRSFTPNETKWILNSPNIHSPITKNHLLNHEEMVRFFLLWSAKEAYLKADGRGFQGLDSLVLFPEKERMLGDLHDGVMLLTTLPHLSDLIHSSFAIYLPHLLKEHLSMTQLSFDVDPIMPIPLNLHWQSCLYDQK